MAAIMIQTAGTRGARRRQVKGAKAPADAVTLSAKHLPNPHKHATACRDDAERLEFVKRFLLAACPVEVERLVQAGCRAIEAARPVVVVCLYGRDRSRAIAQMIGDRFDRGRVYYVHREAL